MIAVCRTLTAVCSCTVATYVALNAGVVYAADATEAPAAPSAAAPADATEAPAAMQRPTGSSPFAPDLAIHGTLTAGMLAVAALYRLAVLPSMPGGLGCTPPAGRNYCDPSGLNSLDRSVIDNGSPAMALVSDATLVMSVVFPLIALSADALLGESAMPWADLLSDVVVWGEAVGVALVTTVVIGAAIRRPRPIQYVEDHPPLTPESRYSFPSGHVSMVTAATVAYAMIFGRRHPDSMWRHAVYIGAVALSVTTSIGRVADRRHFYTDVIAGMLLGAVAGFVVPYLHLRDGPPLSVAPAIGVRDGVQTYGLQIGGRL